MRLGDEAPRLLLELGYWCVQQGQPDDAETLLKGARALRPGTPTASMFLGMARFAAGRPAEAERTYREILETQDDDLTRAFLAESLLAQKRWNEARSLLEEVVTANRHPAAVRFAGELLEGLKSGVFQRA
jgi:Flp pilus assembly protein TadD